MTSLTLGLGIGPPAIGGHGYAGAAYRVTFDATQVSTTETDVRMPIDLAEMPASFWTNVQEGGANLRAYSGGAEIPLAVVRVDTGQELGGVVAYLPTVDSSADTVVDIVCLSAISELPAVGSTNGRDAVFADLQAAWVGGPTHNDFSGAGAWDIPAFNSRFIQLSDLGTFNTFGRNYHQGVAYDSAENQWFGIDTMHVDRLNSSYVIQTSNASLNSQVATDLGLGAGAVDHLGAGCVVGDYLIIPLSNYPTETVACLAVVNKTTLALISSINISATTGKAGSVCWNDAEQRLIVIDWDDAGGASEFYKYSLTGTTLALDSTVSLSANLSEIQGIEYYENAYWMVEGVNGRIIQMSLAGVTDGARYFGTLAESAYEGLTKYQGTLMATVDPAGNTYIQQFRPVAYPMSVGGGVTKTSFSPYASLSGIATATTGYSFGVTFNNVQDDTSCIATFLEAGGAQSNDRGGLIVRRSGGVNYLGFWDGNGGNSYTPPTASDAPALTNSTDYRAWVCYDPVAETITLYLNGSQVFQRTSVTIDCGAYDTIFLGMDDEDTNEVFYGTLGYMLFQRGTPPTASEIALEYLALNDPSTLYSIAEI